MTYLLARLMKRRSRRCTGVRVAALTLVMVSPALALVAQEPPLTLTAALETAVSTDPTVAAALAHRDGAEADVDGSRALRLPSVSLDGSLTRFQEPMVVAPLHSFDPNRPPLFDETLVQGTARVRYTAYDGGAARAREDAAGSGHDAAEASVRGARAALLERVVEAYLGVLTARSQGEAATRMRSALEEERARARQNVDAGTSAEVEALRAEAALAEAIADEAAIRARTELAERHLARVAGLHPTDVVGRPLQEVTLAESASSSMDVLPIRETRDDITAHPDLARAAAVERSALARVGERRAARLPRLELSAAAMDYGTATGNHVVEWQAGLMLSWPVFTGGARGASIRKAEAELSAAREERAARELAVAAHVDGARAEITEADARASALGAAVDQWEEVTRIERLALETGAGVQSDLLAAEARLFQARAGWSRARYDRVLARSRLARALGILDQAWLSQTLEMGS